MVKENAVTGIHAVGFPVVDGDPVGVEFGNGIRRPWVEGGGFLLGDFLDKTIEFTGTGLVEAGLLLQAEDPDSLEDAQGA